MVARLALSVHMLLRIRRLEQATLGHGLLRTGEGLTNGLVKLISLELCNLWRFHL